MKHKDFLLGIMIGASVCCSLTAIATDQYDIYPNPFKILVDGYEKHIEGYNINGYSYFKLRDIGKHARFNVILRCILY